MKTWLNENKIDALVDRVKQYEVKAASHDRLQRELQALLPSLDETGVAYKLLLEDLVNANRDMIYCSVNALADVFSLYAYLSQRSDEQLARIVDQSIQCDIAKHSKTTDQLICTLRTCVDDLKYDFDLFSCAYLCYAEQLHALIYPQKRNCP